MSTISHSIPFPVLTAQRLAGCEAASALSRWRHAAVGRGFVGPGRAAHDVLAAWSAVRRLDPLGFDEDDRQAAEELEASVERDAEKLLEASVAYDPLPQLAERLDELSQGWERVEAECFITADYDPEKALDADERAELQDNLASATIELLAEADRAALWVAAVAELDTRNRGRGRVGAALGRLDTLDAAVIERPSLFAAAAGYAGLVASGLRADLDEADPGLAGASQIIERTTDLLLELEGGTGFTEGGREGDTEPVATVAPGPPAARREEIIRILEITRFPDANYDPAQEDEAPHVMPRLPLMADPHVRPVLEPPADGLQVPEAVPWGSIDVEGDQVAVERCEDEGEGLYVLTRIKATNRMPQKIRLGDMWYELKRLSNSARLWIVGLDDTAVSLLVGDSDGGNITGRFVDG